LYRLLGNSSDNVIGTRISEQFTNEDYQELIPMWKDAIQQHGKIRLLWQMDDFKGWSPAGLLADMKFASRHNREIERLAMVGQKRWQNWMTKSVDLGFSQTDVCYFEPSQLQEAWDWVQK